MELTVPTLNTVALSIGSTQTELKEKLETAIANLPDAKPVQTLYKREELEEECFIALSEIGTHRFKFKHATGGMAINGEGHDYDVVVLPYSPIDLQFHLEKLGWTLQGDYEDLGVSTFNSYRKGNINLIVVYSEDNYWKWLRSVTRCLKEKLMEAPMEREDRVRIFKEVLYAS